MSLSLNCSDSEIVLGSDSTVSFFFFAGSAPLLLVMLLLAPDALTAADDCPGESAGLRCWRLPDDGDGVAQAA